MSFLPGRMARCLQTIERTFVRRLAAGRKTVLLPGVLAGRTAQHAAVRVERAVGYFGVGASLGVLHRSMEHDGIKEGL